MRILAVTVLSLCFGAAAIAAPSADLWERWQAHDETATATIDHSAFSSLLEQYVVVHENGPNGVRYAAISDADRQQLSDYLDAMQAVDIDNYSRDVQRAYWTNLYNAATLDVVLEEYPVDSIRDIGGSLFSSGPWDDKILTVAGEQLSLNDIEHRILRPIWNDPLTHYGVNCASIGCPSLLTEAYTGANVNDKLRVNAHDYINSPEGVTIDGSRITASKIYDWFVADFGGDVDGVISHLRQYAEPSLSADLEARERINSYTYDWSLNDEASIASSSASN